MEVDQTAPNLERTENNLLLWHRYVTSFRNEGGSKTSGVKDRGQISLFDPCKIRGRMGENAERGDRADTAEPVVYI